MKEKAIVLENGFIIDIPNEMKEYLKTHKIEWEWYDTRFSFWKENREATVKYFSNLPKGQLLICSTVFDGFQQLELFINLLHKLKDKNFSFKIMHGCLCNDFIDFLDEYESSITPKELDDYPDKREDFKKEMNQKFFEVLQYHNIYWLDRFSSDGIVLKNLEDIKENCF